jgi:hypothetical protein
MFTDTGTQYAGLTDTEKVMAAVDSHMRECDCPKIGDCAECGYRLGKIRLSLAALADAGLLREPDTGPRVWTMPQIPNAVRTVRDRHGRQWEAHHQPKPFEHHYDRQLWSHTCASRVENKTDCARCGATFTGETSTEAGQ